MTDDSDDNAKKDDAKTEETTPAEPHAKRKKKKKLSAKGKAKARPASAAAPPPSARPGARSQALFTFAAIALVVGAGLGWLLRGMRGGGIDAGPDPASSAGPVGSGGPCAAWSQAICKEAGPESEACTQAKGAGDILSPTACSQALADVPATMEKLKTARSTCDELMNKICNELGQETQTCKMVKEKTPSFPASRCKEMLGNYDKVIGELKRMEKQNAPLSAADAAKQRAGTGPSYGPADAKVAVVEYSDFECPYCAQAAKTLNKLKDRYGKVVRFVFRQYPLPMHPNAPLAAEASLAAHQEGKFWQYHDLLFENQRALDRASLEKYAKEIGLDMAKFKKALDDHSYAAAMKADQKLGEELGVSGTPTMIVGNERVANPTDVAAVSSIIDKQLAAAGVPVPPAPKESAKEGKEGKEGKGADPHAGHGHAPEAPKAPGK